MYHITKSRQPRLPWTNLVPSDPLECDTASLCGGELHSRSISDASDGLHTSSYSDYSIGICGHRCLPPHNVLTILPLWSRSAILELVSGRKYTEMVGKLQLAPLEAVVLKAHPMQRLRWWVGLEGTAQLRCWTCC